MTLRVLNTLSGEREEFRPALVSIRRLLTLSVTGF